MKMMAPCLCVFASLSSKRAVSLYALKSGASSSSLLIRLFVNRNEWMGRTESKSGNLCPTSSPSSENGCYRRHQSNLLSTNARSCSSSPLLSILSSPYLPFITTLHPINRESFQHLRGLSNMTSAFLLIFGHLRAILGTLYTNIEHSITLFPLALVISPTYIFPYLRDR